jgi:tetratricopeptide (TPR) repeat protein/GT2 family glycosyltransferase
LIQAARLSQLFPPLRQSRLHRLLRRANLARNQGDHGKAESLYSRALALDTGRADIRVQLAHMLKELARFSEAEAAYRQALAQSPNDPDIRLQLEHLLKMLGRIEDTTAVSFITADSHAAGLGTDERIANGDRLRDGRQYEAAAEAYGEALKLLPLRTDIRVQYGNMLKDSGRLAEAETAYRAALASAPDNPEIHLQLGHVFKLQGRREKALAAYRQAADLDPSLKAAQVELSMAGCPQAQQQGFTDQIARGGIEALLAVSNEVMRLRESLSRIAAILPDIRDLTAFPVAAYDRLRSLYDVQAPPAPGSSVGFGVMLSAIGMPLEALYDQLASLQAQTHCNWQLAVIGTDAAQRRVIDRAAAADSRIFWIEARRSDTRESAEHRAALELSVDWLVLPGKDARLHRHALAWYAAAIGLHDTGAFVSDSEEAIIGADGSPERLAPQFRQVVDYDTLLEVNPFGETIAVQREAYAAVAGELAMSSSGAARSSLLLALASRRTVGHIPLPLTSITYANEAGHSAVGADLAGGHQEAVRAHLVTHNLTDRVAIGTGMDPGSRTAIEWRPRDPEEIIQVIVPTRDHGDDVRYFVESLRRRAAAPASLRVMVIDNGSEQIETVRILERLSAEEGVRVVRMDEPFNWSRLNSRAAVLCDAQMLVFANDDMVMLTDGWDRQLRGLLERSEIGAVGARLIYPDDTVQHAGILLGWPHIAEHDGRYEPVSNPGPGSRWHVTRAVSAVTGAFLAVRRTVFEAVGGFDETALPIAYSDIDFALKVRARGLRILWTPNISLRHYESKSRGLDHLDPEKRVRNEAERRVMEERWGAALRIDPGVNPIWHSATLPFRLISAPSREWIWRHIRLCASQNPWLPDRSGTADGYQAP